MDLYDQPNVKGWNGGQDWMTSQIYADRNQFIDFFILGNKRFEKVLNKRLENFDFGTVNLIPKLNISNTKNAQTIVEELLQRTVFDKNDDLKKDLNQILKYDFGPRAENAEKSILKVYQFIVKSPEFQII